MRPMGYANTTMHNNIQVFNHELFGQIRTIAMPDGQIGFVGKDVAEALGYSRTADAIRKHVDEEDKGVFKMETPGGVQSTTFISEACKARTFLARLCRLQGKNFHGRAAWNVKYESGKTFAWLKK